MALSKLTNDELESLNKLKGNSRPRVVYEEDVVEAEFLMKFGFEAYWAIYPEKDRSAGINGREMSRLLEASRKLDGQTLYDNALAAFIGSRSARSGNKSMREFESMTSKIIKNTKAE